MDLSIRNGTVIGPDGLRRADVGIYGEAIAEVGPKLRARTAIDATGCLVIPGGVDPHVHLQMAQREYTSADDFESGTVAAAHGGTTTVIDFVEPRPGDSLLEALDARRTEADGRVAIDYGLHMTIPAWHAARPDSLDVLPDLVARGVTSFKLYTAYDGLRLDDARLYTTLKRIGYAGGLPIVHCENGPVCEALQLEAVGQGNISPPFHARTRPPRQEAEAAGRVIDLAALAGTPVYIVHVSCTGALQRLRSARARGELVAGETCPQYLLLGDGRLDGPHGERFVCAPPLRSGEDRAALWSALVAGDVDVLATDHCPFTAAEKAGRRRPGGHADFRSIPGGLPSIEARMGLAWSFGQAWGITPTRWAASCAGNAARIFGLVRKGHIRRGLDADVVVFDPTRGVDLRAQDSLHERVDWSPYDGLRVHGWPRHVIVRGRVVIRDGEYVGHLGWGRYTPRRRSSLLG